MSSTAIAARPHRHPARSAFFLKLFRMYLRRKFQSSFDGIYLSGLSEIQELAKTHSVVASANHVAWWDALLLVSAVEPIGIPSFALMDEDNLKKYPFFGWLGAIPLNRSGGIKVKRDIQYALQLLRSARCVVWMFPQGRQRAAHLRPLGIKSGIFSIIKRTDALHIPVSITYGYREAPNPTILMHFGEPLPTPESQQDCINQLEARITAGLAKNDAALDADDLTDYTPLFAGKQKHEGDGFGAMVLKFFAPRASR